MIRKMRVDHTRGDKLDNRKKELRFLTRSQNALNSSISSNNTSGYIGVSFHKQKRRWRAHIMINRKQIHLGLFNTAEGAAAARAIAEVEYGAQKVGGN